MKTITSNVEKQIDKPQLDKMQESERGELVEKIIPANKGELIKDKIEKVKEGKVL